MLTFVYGTISVLIISLVGLVIVIFLPCLQHEPQSNLSQVFVGLAIGTLTSDALLHLLPHVRILNFAKKKSALSINCFFLLQAFLPNSHHHSKNGTIYHDAHDHNTEGQHSHQDYVWFGLMALLGMIGFLLFERLVMIIRDLAHQHMNDSNVSLDI